MKKITLFILSITLLVGVIFLFNFENVSDYYTKTQGDFPVTISIDCSTILSNTDKLENNLKESKYIPENGVILEKTTVYVNYGDSVLEALKKTAKEHDIQLEYSQSPNDSYVQGINFIYEFSCGDLSGWMYKVNGEFANKGCSSYKLNENDNVEWVYTCDLGKDIGEDFK